MSAGLPCPFSDRKVVEDQKLRHVRLEVFCLARRSELSNAELCVATSRLIDVTGSHLV
jgi:hypothetical protein